jgi:DNA-3-methyladenine glycosylase I
VSDDDPERCTWCGDDPLYLAYHDEEWGLPCRDEHALFELLMLEGMQAGLAWITILRKREGFRAAFMGFDAQRIARFDHGDRQRLLADAGIVRNRAKVDAVIGNARALLALQARDLSLTDLCWEVVDGQAIQNRFAQQADVPAQTPASNALSRRLRGLGFRFVGPTICYAFMQAAGLVNDHLISCHRHGACARASGHLLD